MDFKISLRENGDFVVEYPENPTWSENQVSMVSGVVDQLTNPNIKTSSMEGNNAVK